MTDHEKRIREALEAHDLFGISLEDWGKACTPTAIRSLLADLDAVRGALEKIAKADNSESGCYYTNRANINIARAALKGASHD